ncbi:MAG: hypothetical protein ACI9UA_003068 [Pseudoalteromonas tetraodonis]
MLSVLPWDSEVVSTSAVIRAELERAVTKIDAYDTLLAGQTLFLGLILVSNNTSGFSRVKNLQIEYLAKLRRNFDLQSKPEELSCRPRHWASICNHSHPIATVSSSFRRCSRGNGVPSSVFNVCLIA